MCVHERMRRMFGEKLGQFYYVPANTSGSMTAAVLGAHMKNGRDCISVGQIVLPHK